MANLTVSIDDFSDEQFGAYAAALSKSDRDALFEDLDAYIQAQEIVLLEREVGAIIDEYFPNGVPSITAMYAHQATCVGV